MTLAAGVGLHVRSQTLPNQVLPLGGHPKEVRQQPNLRSLHMTANNATTVAEVVDELLRCANTLLALLPTEASNAHGGYRLDLVFWISTEGDEDSLSHSGQEVSRALGSADLPLIDDLLDDPWSSVGTPSWREYPAQWNHLTGASGSLLHTRSGLGAAGLWLIIGNAPYDDKSDQDLSSLTEIDGRTARPGPLAAYVSAGADARCHLIASRLHALDARALESAIAQPPAAQNARLPELVDAISGMSEAVGNLAPTDANLHRTRRRMIEALNRILKVPANALKDWAEEEAQDDISRDATMRSNLARYEARHMVMAEQSRHADALQSRLETRSNTRATMLLAVVAGAFAGGALADDRSTRIAATVAVGGLLLAMATRISPHIGMTGEESSGPPDLLLWAGLTTGLSGGAWIVWPGAHVAVVALATGALAAIGIVAFLDSHS